MVDSCAALLSGLRRPVPPARTRLPALPLQHLHHKAVCSPGCVAPCNLLAPACLPCCCSICTTKLCCALNPMPCADIMRFLLAQLGELGGVADRTIEQLGLLTGEEGWLWLPHQNSPRRRLPDGCVPHQGVCLVAAQLALTRLALAHRRQATGAEREPARAGAAGICAAGSAASVRCERVLM